MGVSLVLFVGLAFKYVNEALTLERREQQQVQQEIQTNPKKEEYYMYTLILATVPVEVIYVINSFNNLFHVFPSHFSDLLYLTKHATIIDLLEHSTKDSNTFLIVYRN